MAFVLDGLMTLAWCFPDERTEFTNAVIRRMSDEAAHVPAIWPLDVANGLLNGERRGRLTEAEIESFLEEIRSFEFVIDDPSQSTAFNSILGIARRNDLTSYDASYLELTMRLGLPLATLDTRLADAATRAGVPLIAE